jgi:hypothetical protein
MHMMNHRGNARATAELFSKPVWSGAPPSRRLFCVKAKAAMLYKHCKRIGETPALSGRKTAFAAGSAGPPPQVPEVPGLAAFEKEWV